MKEIFTILKPLSRTSFAYAIREFLISFFNNKDEAKEFWIDWMSNGNKSLKYIYIKSWNNPLKLFNQETPVYNIEILTKIKEYFILTDNLNLDYLIKDVMEKIEFDHKNNIIIWCPSTLTWKNQNLAESHLLIKKNLIDKLNEIDLKYNDLKIYLCENENNNIKIDTQKLRFEITKECDKINKEIMFHIKSLTKKKINFNNQNPYFIGFGDKYILDLKTKKYRTREYNDYLISNIEYRKINERPDEYCFPICDWFEKNDWINIQLIFGSFLTGEHDQCFYILHGEGSNGKSTFLNILKILFGDYFIFVSPELFINKLTEKLEREYNLIEKRLAVLDIQQCKINETKLISLTEKYKNCKFILCLNDVPEFSFSKYSTKRRFINIPFKYTFKPEPIYKNDKNINKYLDIDYNQVFSWMLTGCSEYITSEKTITQLVFNYLNTINELFDCTYENFLKDNIEITTNDKDRIGFRDLYTYFKTYITNRNGEMLKEKEFLNKLKPKYQHKKFKNANYFIFIKLRV